MPIMGRTIWVGTKFGIIGGALYYTTDIGLWGSQTQTEQLYKDLYKTASPFVKQTPVEFPELPRVSDVTRQVTHYWNQGVIESLDFLTNIPTHTVKLATSAYDKINELVGDPAPPS